MLRYYFLFILFIHSSFLLSQSISYSIGYGLPRSEEIGSLSIHSENYNKGQEFSIGLGLSNTKTLADQIEIRLSTYQSTLETYRGNFFGTSGISLSIRKYIMELQSYFIKFNWQKFGSIDFGSKISFLVRSDVAGYSFTETFHSQIISADYNRKGKFYGSLLAKFSVPSIQLSNSQSLVPSYTFSYSFNDDMDTSSTNTKLIKHIFEIAIIKDLSAKK